MALHLFIDNSEATDFINELTACHKEIMTLSSEKKAKISQTSEGESRPYWLEVVTELIISFMTHEKIFFRNIAKGVFM